MNQMGEFLTQYATKEVFTVIGAIVVAVMGWKAAKGTLGFVGGIAKKASFMGLASALLVSAGLGASFLGIGELRSRPSDTAKQPGLTNEQIVQILMNERGLLSPELLRQTLEYVQHRDSVAPAKKSNEKLTVFRLDGEKLVPVSLNDYDSDVPFTVKPANEIVTADESIMSVPMAWMLIGLGGAASLTGSVVYLNRNNRRSTDDPHHPNYDKQYVHVKL